MEATKKLNGKAVGKWLSNNAIIMMMLAVTLIVGIIHPNFFSGTNMINLFKNVSIRYIIALGISGCLITTGNDLSAGRLAGFAACLACIFAQTEGASGKFYPNMPLRRMAGQRSRGQTLCPAFAASHPGSPCYTPR